MRKGFFYIILTLLCFSSVFADTNGIWTYAKDIVPGTFGSDEGYGPFTFDGIVNFLQPVIFKGNVDMNDGLNVSSNSGKAIWAESSVNDGIAGVTSATGKSAIYGWAKNSNAYSGYFEGGKFYVNSNNIVLASKHSCGKLYTDVNGNVLCGVDQVNDADSDPTNELQDLNSVLARGNNAGGRRIINVANPVNAQDVATKAYVDSNRGLNWGSSVPTGVTCTYSHTWGAYKITKTLTLSPEVTIYSGRLAIKYSKKLYVFSDIWYSEYFYCERYYLGYFTPCACKVIEDFPSDWTW